MKTKYPKLPKEFKKKWLVALRSGKYKQASGSLCNKRGYCCLGVAARSQGIANKWFENKGYYETSWRFENWDRIKRLIPEQLLGALEINSTVQILANMNDGTGDYVDKPKSFKQIANWIENNL